MIPIHDVNPTRRFAWVTVALSAATALLFRGRGQRPPFQRLPRRPDYR